MKLKPETIQAQHALADYCRTGKNVKLDGITPNRIHHYRRLVFNVVKNTISQAFPISKKIIGDHWENLVHNFFVNHNSQTPQVWKLPFEFYEYIKKEKYANKLQLPFLNDLLYFEWIEIEVYTMPDIEINPFEKNGDMLNDALVVNPEFKLMLLEYPVHIFEAQAAVQKKGNFYVLCFREPETGKVKFINLSIFHVFIIERLLNSHNSLSLIIDEAIQFFEIIDTTYLWKNTQRFIQDMMNQKFILGYKILN